MTPLTKKISRLSSVELDGSFGPDRNKRIVITLIPGDGKQIPDLLELRPQRTRRAERIAVMDAYRYAMRCRVNRVVLEKARMKKEKKAVRLAAQRQERAEKKLLRPCGGAS